LASLPLTAALSRQLENPSDRGRPAAAPETEEPRPPLSWESLEEGAAGLLNAAYILVVRDLMGLKADFPWTASESLSWEDLSSQTTYPTQTIRQALRQTKKDLFELYLLLSD